MYHLRFTAIKKKQQQNGDEVCRAERQAARANGASHLPKIHFNPEGGDYGEEKNAESRPCENAVQY